MDLTFDRFRLAASTADLSTEPAARDHADLVEFRMDLAADPVAAVVDYDGDLPLLVTNRAEWEGGGCDASEAERIDDLVAAAESETVVAADVELATLEETPDVGDRLRDADAAVVASAHDFEATPERERLDDVLAQAARLGDVGKLATTARNRTDTLALLSATHEATTAGLTVATMAMGAPGSHTRAVAPLYGSRIGYAPVDAADATAPGQYDLETLASLVATLDAGSGKR
jgi:3-dehydroquinate dehydratase-1